MPKKWNGKKDKLRWTLAGLSILNDTKSGEPLLYGYLELKGDLKGKLDSAAMHTNANASSSITIGKALSSHAYRFDILYYGDKPIGDFAKSESIKKRTFYNTGEKLKVQDTRAVRYSLEPGPSALTIRTAELINYFDTFFNQNPQELLNRGGDSILDFLQYRSLVVTKVEIVEQWHRQGKSLIREIKSIEPYVFGVKAATIPYDEFKTWGVQAEGKLLSDLILTDDYYRRVITINSTLIAPGQSNQAWILLQSDIWPTLHSDLTQ